MAKKKNTLVPYDQVSPGFEALYTGKTSSKPVRKSEMISTLHSDKNGNLISQWSTIPWTFPNEKGQWKEVKWDDTVKCLHRMQSKLGPLDDNIRKIRVLIGGLIPCDSGFPVFVDELLDAIGRGKINPPTFRNGCLCAMWWKLKTTQPRHTESMRTIHAVLKGYLAGKAKKDFIRKFPHAEGFINRTYKWLGPVDKLTDVQKLMFDRMFLTIDFFAQFGVTVPEVHSLKNMDLKEIESIGKDLFCDEGGRGACLDAEISKKAGLPKIHPRWNPTFQENLDSIKNPKKKELYRICSAIAEGVYTLSDCHHNTFRVIENQIHGIGAGKASIPTRKAGTEKERMGHLLFGYVLGLDKWLVGIPMQFLLLDLGHIDLGFDTKNEILRVYSYLGEERSTVKEWLAGCLWYNLTHNEQGGLVRHKELLERAEKAGLNLREWMDSAFRNLERKMEVEQRTSL
jgi:hypothetical protein